MRKRKKILINLLNFVSPEIAGTGVFAKNILRHWLLNIDHTTTITILHSASINVCDVFEIVPHERIDFIRLDIQNFVSRIFFEQFVLPIKLRIFDLYFSPTPAVPLLAKVFGKGTQLIITIHDMIPFFVPRKYGLVRGWYVKFISKFGARLADTVITVSENSSKDIRDIAGISPAKIKVVYNFMDSATVSEQITYGRFFISISTIEPGKNIENTIQGFKRFILTNGNDDYKFYWIGKIGWGYTKQSLTNLINNVGLQGKFVLLGYVNEDEKRNLLSTCMATVYLSHYEGFGLPVLEGLSFYKPAVVSNTSSLPEVIGKAGVLCDKEDPDDINRALSDITIDIDKYVKEIPTQLKKFSAPSQIEKFLQIVSLK